MMRLMDGIQHKYMVDGWFITHYTHMRTCTHFWHVFA